MGNGGGEESTVDSLHIAVIPWLALGHLTPFVELSTRIARLGHRVSFVSTPSNLRRFPFSATAGLHLIPLPPISVAVSAAECTFDLPDDSLRPHLDAAFDALEPLIVAALLQASPPVDWLLFDFTAHWAPRVAEKIGARSALVGLVNAAVHSFLGPPDRLARCPWTDPDELTSPPEWVPFPSDVAFRPHEARAALRWAAGPSGPVSVNYRFGASAAGCDVAAVRSCDELEPEWLALLPRLYGKPVIPLGLFPQSPPPSSTVDWREAFDWLDRQPPRSVAYAAFGSEVRFDAAQIQEIANGLERSGLRFIWAARKAPPEGFKDRTSERGFVCEGWAPQVSILAHQAVGGFLTHCGWSSAVEGLRSGVALAMLPVMFDQALNARMLAGKGLGVEVPRDDDGGFDGDGIARVLKAVMVGDEGDNVRVRVRETRGLLGDDEVHDGYVRRFVEHLKEHKVSSRV